MNKDIKVYVPFDSLYDYRQGLMCRLMTEGIEDMSERFGKAQQLWTDNVEKLYRGRVFDTYEYSSVGINKTLFDKAYEERNVSDVIYYTPTKLFQHILSLVMSVESSYDQLPSIKSFEIFINIWPYEFDKDLQKDLLDSIHKRFRGRHPVRLISVDERKATPNYFKSFNYVFMYNFFLRDYNRFGELLKTEPIPETIFFVPDVRAQAVDHITGTSKDVIEAFAYVLSPQIGIRPIPHEIYDYSPS